MHPNVYSVDFPFPDPSLPIIDVRSPSEFAEDHIPGAMSLPVLNDEERAQVGEVYHRVGKFEAKRMGAAMISRNIALYLETVLRNCPKDFSPILYCWRGGQRSGSLATVFGAIGWRTGLLPGGYRNYRKRVLEGLGSVPKAVSFLVIGGLTGCGKSLILRELKRMGEPILDLEEVARHRGSLFGPLADTPQPSQKFFESQLYHDLLGREWKGPVWVESEGRRLGYLDLPSSLWQRLSGGRMIEVVAEREHRTAYILSEYRDWMSRKAEVEGILNTLRVAHSNETVEHWLELQRNGQWGLFVDSLLELHYDPTYRKGLTKRFNPPLKMVQVNPTDESSILRVAEELKRYRESFLETESF